MSFLTLTAVLGSEYLQANQGYVDTYWNLLHLDDVWNRGLLNDIIWPKVIFYTGQYNSSGGKPLIGRGGRYFPDSLNFNLQLLPELFINHNQHVVSTSSNSRTYGKYSGLCLETQRFGDSPHHPNFPTWELKPGEVRRCPALLVRCINMIKYMIKKLYHSKIYNFLVWPQAHFSGVRTRHFLPVLHSLSLTKKGIYWNTNKYVTKHGTWLKEYCVHLEYSGLLAQALLFVLFCDSPTKPFPRLPARLCQCLPTISSVSIFLSKCGVEGPDVNCTEYITVRYWQ